MGLNPLDTLWEKFGCITDGYDVSAFKIEYGNYNVKVWPILRIKEENIIGERLFETELFHKSPYFRWARVINNMPNSKEEEKLISLYKKIVSYESTDENPYFPEQEIEYPEYLQAYNELLTTCFGINSLRIKVTEKGNLIVRVKNEKKEFKISPQIFYLPFYLAGKVGFVRGAIAGMGIINLLYPPLRGSFVLPKRITVCHKNSDYPTYYKLEADGDSLMKILATTDDERLMTLGGKILNNLRESELLITTLVKNWKETLAIKDNENLIESMEFETEKVFKQVSVAIDYWIREKEIDKIVDFLNQKYRTEYEKIHDLIKDVFNEFGVNDKTIPLSAFFKEFKVKELYVVASVPYSFNSTITIPFYFTNQCGTKLKERKTLPLEKKQSKLVL